MCRQVDGWLAGPLPGAGAALFSVDVQTGRRSRQACLLSGAGAALHAGALSYLPSGVWTEDSGVDVDVDFGVDPARL